MTTSAARIAWRAFLVAGVFLPGAVRAQGAAAPRTQDQIRQELSESWKAGAAVAVRAGHAARLGGQGEFRIPDHTVFIPGPQAARIMRAYGNGTSPSLLGIVTSDDDRDDWIATVHYLPEGYIRDDDARDWNADELLRNIRDGTEEANKDRKARGFPELEILGWIEKPAYNARTHRLVWSAEVRKAGAAASEEHTVNYNTYVLGREGYFSLDFITGASRIEGQKPLAQTLLGGLQFDLGKRYEDFNSGTDKVAAYGLAALVGGVVLKKAGLLALMAAFALKFAKLGIVAVAAIGAGIAKLFRRGPPTGPDA